MDQVYERLDQSDAFRVAHDEDVGTGHKIGYGTNGLHEDAAAFGITQFRSFLYGLLGFLAFPDFISQVVDQGELEFVVTLGQGCHGEPLHYRIGVLHAVAQSAGGGINDHLGEGDPQVFQENVDLFCQVDVDG